MKRIICVLCTLMIIIALSGCIDKHGDIQTPVNFYYCNNAVAYNDENGVIAAEVREGADCTDMEQLLALYLQGPISDGLYNPMPADIQLLSCQQEGPLFSVYLSKSFAKVKGVPQSLAGACLAKTIMGLTDVETVQIFSPTGPEDTTPVMVLDHQSLLLIDNSQ